MRQRRRWVCSHVLHHFSRIRAAGLPCVWHSGARLQHLRGRHVSIRLGYDELLLKSPQIPYTRMQAQLDAREYTFRRTHQKLVRVYYLRETLKRLANKAQDGFSNSPFYSFVTRSPHSDLTDSTRVLIDLACRPRALFY